MTSRQQYHEELDALHERLLEMGALVEQVVQQSVDSLARLDVPLAEHVIATDDTLDAMELEIERRCIRLIALQQPMAADLRLLATILKVVTDLERMADNAVNISEITLRLAGQELVKPLVDIPKMADLAVRMVHDALAALVRRDEQLARDVCQRDDAVDDMYALLFEELVVMMKNDSDPDRVSQCANLMFTARFLERISDHATNVGERVVYLVSGERVKLG